MLGTLQSLITQRPLTARALSFDGAPLFVGEPLGRDAALRASEQEREGFAEGAQGGPRGGGTARPRRRVPRPRTRPQAAARPQPTFADKCRPQPTFVSAVLYGKRSFSVTRVTKAASHLGAPGCQPRGAPSLSKFTLWFVQREQGVRIYGHSERGYRGSRCGRRPLPTATLALCPSRRTVAACAGCGMAPRPASRRA